MWLVASAFHMSVMCIQWKWSTVHIHQGANVWILGVLHYALSAFEVFINLATCVSFKALQKQTACVLSLR